MNVFDRGRRLETHGEVGIFRIILGIQVESACLAVSSLLYIDVTDSLMIEYAVSPMMLFFIIDWC